MPLGHQLDAVTNQNSLNQSTQPAVMPAMTPEQVTRLQQIKVRAGWIQPDHAVSLAKSGASDQTVDAVGVMNAKRIAVEQASPQPEGDWVQRNIVDKIKSSVRWSQAALQFVPEFVQGGVGQFFDSNKNVDGWFKSTTVGSMIENPELQGSGYVIGKQLMDVQAERARKYRGTINGSAYTVGRGSANLIFKPNSKPYNILSGVIDALVMLKFDPTKDVIAAAKYATKSRYLVPLLSEAEASGLRAALHSEAGITAGLSEYGLDQSKLATFFDKNRRMVTLVDRLTAETSPLRIAEDMNLQGLPNEVITALADAKNPEAVKSILATGWTIAGEALPQDIRDIQGLRFKSQIGDFLVERMPLIDGIRKSRYFTTMEKAAIVMHGTTQDNNNAVKSAVSWMRTAGIAPDTIETVANDMMRSFTPAASDVARKQALDAFHAILGTAFERDGIPKESVDMLYRHVREGVEKMRLYLIDRKGIPTDNGFGAFIRNTNRDYNTIDELEKLMAEMGGEKLAITSPMQLVEMLDRVHILPDLREVRRMTRGKLVGEMFAKLGIDKSVSFASRRVPTTVTEIVDKQQYDKLGKQIAELVGRQFKPEDVVDTINELKSQQNDLVRQVMKRVITPEQRSAITAMDYLQNRVWKPMALATGGFAVRNSIDAQVRMAFSDLPALMNHPWEYINLVLGSSKKMTLRLEQVANVRNAPRAGKEVAEGIVTVEDLTKDLRDVLSYGAGKQGVGSVSIADHMENTGSFVTVSREGSPIQHTHAVSQNGYRQHSDTLGKIVNQTFVEHGGATEDARQAAANKIVNVIRKDEAIQKQVHDAALSGWEYRDGSGKILQHPPVDLASMSQEDRIAYYRQYAFSFYVDNNQMLTGNLPEIQFIYAFNKTPATYGKTPGAINDAKQAQSDLGGLLKSLKEELSKAKKGSKDYNDLVAEIRRTETEVSSAVKLAQQRAGKTIPAFQTKLTELVNAETDAPLRVGSVVKVGENNIGVITKLEDAVTHEVLIDPMSEDVFRFELEHPDAIATVQQVDNEDAFAHHGRGTRKTQRIIQKQPLYDEKTKTGLPQVAKYELQKSAPNDAGAFEKIMAPMDAATDFIFNHLNNSITRKLERSPVFREYYYREVAKHVDRLAPEEAQKFLDSLTKRAAITQNNESLAIWTPNTRIEFEGFPEDVSVRAGYSKSENAITKAFSESQNTDFVYHTSPVNRVGSIAEDGLIPQKTVNEFGDIDAPAIYVSSNLDTQLSTAPSPGSQKARLGSNELVIYRFKLPEKVNIEYGTRYGEGVISDNISPKIIEVLDISGEWVPVTQFGITKQLEKYVGDKEIIARMRASTKTAGDVTIAELDDYAKHVAISGVKNLLYDASSKTNLEDSLRIIMPFASAWKEVLGTYLGLMTESPLAFYDHARSAQRIYTGATNADPDNDGRGFFYRDPITNQQMFAFPGSGTLAKVFTGLDVSLTAPVKRLSQGMNAYPAVGPVVQVAISKFLPDVPETDFISKILLPYGRQGIAEGLNPFPQWGQKMVNALEANKADLNGIYANTYMETMQALSASGKYDLNDVNDLKQLKDDATVRAQYLAGFRALSQFFGPTSGASEFKVATKQGDRFASDLIKELHDMQADPKIGYTNAIPRMLALYGDEIALYMGSKTQALKSGLEASGVYGDWERKNGDLLSAYPETSRYLAPTGSDFNFTVFARQLDTGERKRLTDDELIKISQNRIGSAQYADARTRIGPNPNADGKALLRKYRTYLNSKYPGFPLNAEFEVGKYYNDIVELKKLVFDPRVSDQPTSKAIKEYLVAREQAIKMSGVSEQGFRSAKSATALRDNLAAYGMALSASEPSFARIYDRLLASEVE